LNKRGVGIGRYQVRSLMKDQGVEAIAPKKFKPRTTYSKGILASSNWLKDLKIEERAASKVIVGDITYIALLGGKFCYLAMWRDVVTRRVIGWSLMETMDAELVISALEKTITKGLVKAGAIIHSDRGSQYASNGFRKLLRTNGFRGAMSGKGNCYDNAQAKSFFSRFKTELMEGGVFDYRTSPFRNLQLHRRLGVPHRVRLHSSLGYQNPMEFEQNLKIKNGGKVRDFYVR